MLKTGFENLRVYQLALELAEAIWQVVAQWDSMAKDTVGKRIGNQRDRTWEKVGYFRTSRQQISAAWCFYGIRKWLYVFRSYEERGVQIQWLNALGISR